MLNHKQRCLESFNSILFFPLEREYRIICFYCLSSALSIKKREFYLMRYYMYEQSDIQSLKIVHTMCTFMCILHCINFPVDIISNYIKHILFVISLLIAYFWTWFNVIDLKSFPLRLKSFIILLLPHCPRFFFIIYNTHITYILLVIMLM